jgi:hypothetical protein
LSARYAIFSESVLPPERHFGISLPRNSRNQRDIPVHERLPISGIRESYHPVEESRTVVMPALILALLAGLVLFYLKGHPAPSAAGPLAATVTSPGTDPAPVVEPSDPPASVAPVPRIEPVRPPLLTRAGLSENEFTPWMSSLALDTYLRQKNRGYQGSYWSRGHWIRAIEGRWHEGAREFRIALGKMERPGEVQWHYRIDLTEMAFAEELARMSAKEYQLAQSQAYRHPDGSMRYQAVWQRENDAPVAKR